MKVLLQRRAGGVGEFQIRETSTILLFIEGLGELQRTNGNGKSDVFRLGRLTRYSD
jgi:hypothetical protein